MTQNARNRRHVLQVELIARVIFGNQQRIARIGTDFLHSGECRLHAQRLDRSRPPWAFYVIDGLERGRVALYAKVHHGLIDGRGFVELCTKWFGTDPADRSVRALWEGMGAMVEIMEAPAVRSAVSTLAAAPTRNRSASVSSNLSG